MAAWENDPLVEDAGRWMSDPLVDEDKKSDTRPTASVGRDLRGKAAALTSGMARAFPWLAGLPADTVVNLSELLKIPLGVGYRELSGKEPPKALLPLEDRATIPGTQAWIERGLSNNPMLRDIITGGGAAQENPGTHAAGFGAGASLITGRPASVPQVITRAAGGAVPAITSQKTYELTGSPSASVLASLAPSAGLSVADMGLRAALRPSPASAEKIANANVAGIPVGVADVTDSGMVGGFRSVLNSIPIVGRIGKAQQAAKEAAARREIAKTFEAKDLGPESVAEARTTLRGRFNEIYGRNNLVWSDKLEKNLAALEKHASTKMTSDDARVVRGWIKEIRSSATEDNGRRIINGDKLNNIQSAIRVDAESAGGSRGVALSSLRKSIIDAFNASISKKDADTRSDTATKWKALKTVEPLIGKSEAGAAGRTSENFPFALLPERVLKEYGADVYQRGQIPRLPVVSRSGSQVIPDRVLKTGGSDRALVQYSGLGIGGMMFPKSVLTGLLGGSALNWALGSPAALRYATGGQPAGLLGTSVGPVLSRTQELLIDPFQ